MGDTDMRLHMARQQSPDEDPGDGQLGPPGRPLFHPQDCGPRGWGLSGVPSPHTTRPPPGPQLADLCLEEGASGPAGPRETACDRPQDVGPHG